MRGTVQRVPRIVSGTVDLLENKPTANGVRVANAERWGCSASAPRTIDRIPGQRGRLPDDQATIKRVARSSGDFLFEWNEYGMAKSRHTIFVIHLIVTNVRARELYRSLRLGSGALTLPAKSRK